MGWVRLWRAGDQLARPPPLLVVTTLMAQALHDQFVDIFSNERLAHISWWSWSWSKHQMRNQQGAAVGQYPSGGRAGSHLTRASLTRTIQDPNIGGLLLTKKPPSPSDRRHGSFTGEV